jgi:O-antigen chain-terminating methyltransferase
LNQASAHLRQRLIDLRVELSKRAQESEREYEQLRQTSRGNEERMSQLEARLEFVETRLDSTVTSVQDLIVNERRVREEHTALLQGKLDSAAAVHEVVINERRAREEHAALVEAKLESALALVRHLVTKDDPTEDKAHALDTFYAAFEDHFRGDPSIVRKRMEPYLTLVRQCEAGTADASIIDLGCGRGEWLELLRDNGFIARGVDMNRVFLDRCRDHGLQVIEGDAIEILDGTPAASVGMVTSMHLVEHLRFERLIALLDAARRALRSGGMLILETPNPENVSVAHHWFYFDPTHRNPIPPEALRWMVEARGFYNARIERLVTARDWTTQPLVPEETPGARAMNTLISSLNAAPDYAIIATRP